MSDEHVPYNTAPMDLENRMKELDKSGSGTPLAKNKPEKTGKGKKGKKSGKKKADIGGGDEPT